LVVKTIDGQASPAQNYRIGYPAAREGVAALPYTEFVEYTFIGENVQSGKEGTGFVIWIAIGNPETAGGHSGPPLRGVCHRNAGWVERSAVWMAR